MSKILFLQEIESSTANILREMFDGDFRYIFDVTENDINNYDVIFFIRSADIISASIAKKAKDSGHFVISFYDDDLLKYMRIPPWGHYALKKTLNHSNVMLSFNSYLCKKYLKFIPSKRTLKIDMIVKDEQIESYAPHNNEKIKIVYAATPGHAKDFNDIIRPALPEIIDKYGEKISFTFVGLHPDLTEVSDKVEINYVDLLSFSEYRDFMKEQKFDIGLAPLHENEFTKCKYFNKYIEYTMKGIFGMYSCVEPYTQVIESGKNGILVHNNKEDWVNAFEKVIENFDLCVQGVQYAQNDLRKNFSQKKIFNDIAKEIPEFFNYEGQKKRCLPLIRGDVELVRQRGCLPLIRRDVSQRQRGRQRGCESFEFSKSVYNRIRPFEALHRIIYRICYYLKEGGMKNLILRSVEHFRRKFTHNS